MSTRTTGSAISRPAVRTIRTNIDWRNVRRSISFLDYRICAIAVVRYWAELLQDNPWLPVESDRTVLRKHSRTVAIFGGSTDCLPRRLARPQSLKKVGV